MLTRDMCISYASENILNEKHPIFSITCFVGCSIRYGNKVKFGCENVITM